MLRRLASAAVAAVESSAQCARGSVQAAAVSVRGDQGACCPPAPTSRRWYATNSTDVFNVHHDTPENNAATAFDFTDANYERVAEIVGNYPPNYKASAVIPLLDLAQQQNSGWLSLAAMQRVAKVLDMADIRVYEVATFYSMFNRAPVGKYYIQVCGTTPCRLNGAENILSTLEGHLGIKLGQTTPCGTFTIGEMECMGCCVNAPMIVVSDYSNGVKGYSYNYFEDLSPEDAVRIADAYKAGKPPKKGSQYRATCEPAGHMAPGDGKWHPSDGFKALTEAPTGPFCRNLDAVPADAAPDSATKKKGVLRAPGAGLS